MCDHLHIELIVRKLGFGPFDELEIRGIEDISKAVGRERWTLINAQEQFYAHKEITPLRTYTAVAGKDFKSILQHWVAALELEFATVTASLVHFGWGIRSAGWDWAVVLDFIELFGGHVEVHWWIDRMV
jgi:hypothetical protein